MLSLIVPACNEERSIESVVRDLSEIKDSEIIVVCNGCADRTPEIVRSLDVKLIELPEKNKGKAVLEGFRVAEGDCVGFVDADGAFSSADVTKLLDELVSCDCAIASKWKDQSFNSVRGSFGRKIGSRVWNFFVRNMLGLSFADTQAGLKLLKKSIFDDIDSNFVCNGFAFDVELLYKIKRAGYRIREIYIPVRPTDKSSFNMWHAPKMFFNLSKLWFISLFERK